MTTNYLKSVIAECEDKVNRILPHSEDADRLIHEVRAKLRNLRKSLPNENHTFPNSWEEKTHA
jgi:hypothetical protein